MATVALGTGKKFLTNDRGEAIVWLPLGVEVHLGVNGDDVSPDFTPGSPDHRDVVSGDPASVAVLHLSRRYGGITFALKASAAGVFHVNFKDRAGAPAGRLVAVAGDVGSHAGMDIDLIANFQILEIGCVPDTKAKDATVRSLDRYRWRRAINLFDRHGDGLLAVGLGSDLVLQDGSGFFDLLRFRIAGFADARGDRDRDRRSHYVANL